MQIDDVNPFTNVFETSTLNPVSRLQSSQKISARPGQTLLLVVMLMATLATIGASVAFRGQSQTRVTANAQDSKTAFQAAEGILAQALSGVTAKADIKNLSENATSSVEQVVDSFSTTDIVPRDGQYSIYMTDYDLKNNEFGSKYFTGDLKIYFDSEDTCPVLEITAVISGTPTTLKRSVTKKSCNNSDNEVSNTDGVGGSEGLEVSNTTQKINKTQFTKYTTYTVPAKTNMIIVRSLFGGTKLGVNQSIPTQSILVTATARTTSGSQKTVQVYQPYPQIPAEFFVTRF